MGHISPLVSTSSAATGSTVGVVISPNSLVVHSINIRDSRSLGGAVDVSFFDNLVDFGFIMVVTLQRNQTKNITIPFLAPEGLAWATSLDNEAIEVTVFHSQDGA